MLELRALRFLAVKTETSKGLCHDFCVVVRRKQLQIFGKFLEKPFVLQQTGHIEFSAEDAEE